MRQDGLVGISCGCRKLNYGSILQSYALHEAIELLGRPCDFVWIRGNLLKHSNIRPAKILGTMGLCLRHPSMASKVMASIRRLNSGGSAYALPQASREMFESFGSEQLDVNAYGHLGLRRASRTYAKFVVGSDQIWNSWDYWLDPMYFLRFCPRDKRVAYAPSFGTDTVSPYNKNKLRRYIKGFNHVSLREESGREICLELTGKSFPVVLDPTLLLTKQEWIRSLDLQAREGEYCLAYFLGPPSDDAVTLIERLRQDMAITALPVARPCFEESELASAGPKEFLELLMGAKYVVTDSFHGSMLSTLFHKSFLCFGRDYGLGNSQETRITDALARFGLNDRYSTSGGEGLKLLKAGIDWNTVDAKLSELRKDSLGYLSDALSS